MTLRFAAIGLDHRHIYDQVGRLLELGCVCAGFWTEGDPQPPAGFVKRFPGIPWVADKRQLLDDPAIALIVTAALPSDRAALAIKAMERGKDVMTDKPGCTSLAQLEVLREAVARTGRIWLVNYSERFEVHAVTRALELVRAGAIGCHQIDQFLVFTSSTGVEIVPHLRRTSQTQGIPDSRTGPSWCCVAQKAAATCNSTGTRRTGWRTGTMAA